MDLIEAENFAVYYGFDLQNLATWETQVQADVARVSAQKLSGEMVLKRDEFLEREAEAIERRKRTRRKKAAEHNQIP